jgi:cytochrome P450
MCFQLLIAGLDTVASTAAYVFQHLATEPELQAELAVHPDRIPDFLEEAMRMYGVVNTVRTAKRDVQVGDMFVRAGEPILCMLPAAGRDEQRNSQPDTFRLDRRSRQHMLFGGGAHLCVGHFLARIELRVLVEEWLKKIPSFGRKAGFRPEYRLGGMTSLIALPLEWKV